MEEKRVKVVAVPCEDYEEEKVCAAVRAGVRTLGGLEAFLRPEERILVKPNLLKPAEADSAVTTHPAVLRAVLRLLEEYGCHAVLFGDSSGHDSGTHALERLGFRADEPVYGARLTPMSEELRVAFPEGMTEKEFWFAREVTEVDAIVNVCKMKTHGQMRITGAVKNLFGLLCGSRKAREHMRFPNDGLFARMLVDIHRCVKPRLHIMDAIVAMEGNGPGAGTPKKMGLLLFSADPVAIDAVFCALVHVDPETVQTNVQGQAMGIGTWHEDRIELLLAKPGEDGPAVPMTLSAFAQRYGDPAFDVYREKPSSLLARSLSMLSCFSRRPFIDPKRCVHCGVCVEHCPVPGKALSFRKGKDQPPVHDRKKCIRCFCCQEMCPQKAITAGRWGHRG
ncbi:MAG: DUF362 domain-containing protein [Oscillospiraceae bacterium]|nr:DUF362 domain-containing protein [Oscillospiraceae bacterium]